MPLAAGFRFHPPALAISPEVRWALARAFGPVGVPAPSAVDRSALLGAARALDLSARIAARSGPDRLRSEIGAPAEGFLEDSRAAADDAVVHALAAQDVAVVARELSIPLAYLKFQALTVAGYVAGRERRTSDVDVLAADEDAPRLRDELLRRGFHPSGEAEYEHQMSAVVHPFGVSIDLHRKLLGVRIAGSRSADAGTLLGRGLCAPLAGAPGEPLVPARPVLIAHALVHGIAQHGLAPHSYPLLRMVGDLVGLDLPAAMNDPSWASWISHDVSPAEIGAVAGLCARLRAGSNPDEGEAEEKALLAHVVTAAFEPAYARSLALSRWLREPTDRSRPGKLARSLIHALVPPRRAPAAKGWRGFRDRLARPWVLLARALR